MIFLLGSILAGITMSWLRIIQINDVYDLGRLPHLKSLIEKYSSSNEAGDVDLCITICAGDFLAPSLLSSLDKGAGMVDILDAVGCQYVCLGNHEADVGNDALVKRIHQSKFVWINSNLPDLKNKLKNMKDLPRFQILNVGEKKIALLGFLTEDASLYRPDSFGGATIQPIMESAKELSEYLLKEGEVDLILPMTHQSIALDREMANEMGHLFPLLMGGHDHEPYLEIVNGCQIVKTGMDAHQAAVIDVQFEKNCQKPSIQVQMLKTNDFPADPAVKERVAGHESILRELDEAKLFTIKDWIEKDDDKEIPVFSTKDNRLGPSTGTTALCSMLRMGMRCEVALINAGSVRAGKVYDPEDFFTWSDMKAEIPFPTEMSVCSVPGKILQETIQNSRRLAKDKIAKGGYIHTSRTTVCSQDGEIKSILGKDFDPEKKYLTAFPRNFLAGIDNHKPLLDWAATKKQEELPSDHSATPAKLILVELFSALFWLRFGSFEELSRGDGVISKDDVRHRMRQLYGENHEVADLMAESVFKIADKDGDGSVSVTEQMIIRFVASDMLDHVVTESEIEVMKEIASQVLGKDPSHQEIDKMVKETTTSLDLQGNGAIQRDEIMQALGQVIGKDLLQ